MPLFCLIIVILLPILGGALLPFVCRSRRMICIWTFCWTAAASLLLWLLILYAPDTPLLLVRFSDRLLFELQLDGLGRFFGGIVATLWPLTVLYAFEYIEDDPRPGVFFAYFTITYGVTIGVAAAGNIFTLYCFYELLTLASFPLVMHTRTRDAVRAARTYLAMSIGGAAFAFISMIYLVIGQPEISGVSRSFFFLCGFFGFGVKAAIFPLHVWLPRASVAPAPVTALLHAVAVVKAGVFAIIRLSWCGYGAPALRGTAAQTAALVFVCITIVFGSAMALREQHVKRRMAYSTVSNLSYILFGVLLFSEEGLQAGLLHMAFHAEIKILAFFAVGAVMHHTRRKYLSEMAGLGRRMPLTFVCLTVSSLALTGIPPLCGFVSKWSLLRAAAETGTGPAYVGAACILFSALLTAIYCFTILQRAFFPDKAYDLSGLDKVHEAGPLMLIPMLILTAAVIATGFLAGSILDRLAETVRTLSRW